MRHIYKRPHLVSAVLPRGNPTNLARQVGNFTSSFYNALKPSCSCKLFKLTAFWDLFAIWESQFFSRSSLLEQIIATQIALFTVAFSHLHDNVFERGREAVSSNSAVFARNCLTSTLKYIVMQMRKGNCEKGYCMRNH